MGFFPNRMKSSNRPENEIYKEIHINIGTNNPKSCYIVKPFLGKTFLDSKFLLFKNDRFGKCKNTILRKQRAFVGILVFSRQTLRLGRVSGCRGREGNCFGWAVREGRMPFAISKISSRFVYFFICF